MVATNAAMKPKPQQPATAPRMTLAAVTRGKLDVPIRAVLYGTEGVGKSTFAAAAPDAIFLGVESGTAQLDVARMPEPRSWAEVEQGIAALTNETHDFKTLVLDTLDWAEPLCWESVCIDAKKASIEDLGYGKGYIAAVDKWRALLARLDVLRARKGMHLLLLAHAHVKPFRNPEGEDFDRYELKLHQKSAGLIKEWADAVLFANYETFTKKKTKDDRSPVRGVSDGSRLVLTERRAAFDAKNRYGLPYEMPLDWAEFYAAVRAHEPGDPAELTKAIEGMLPDLGEQDNAKVREALTRAGGDANKLAQLANWARAKAALTTKTTDETMETAEVTQ